MKKVILEFDAPENCDECPFRIFTGKTSSCTFKKRRTDYGYCSITIYDSSKIHEHCPLKFVET